MARIWTAFFGRAARRALTDYVLMVTLIMLILLAIAWTIDLARYFPSIRDGAREDGEPLLSVLLPYMSYRAVDMVVRMLPMACFFGIYIAELLRRYRLESIVLITAGFSPRRMLGAILVFAALAGALQQWLEQKGRPQAIIAQVALGYGGYADRFRPHLMNNHVWYLAGDVTIRTRFYRGTPVELRDVLVFTGVQQEEMDKIYAAERGEPADSDGSWRLSNVQVWNAKDLDTPPLQMDTVTLDLSVLPEQTTYHGIPGFYLPDPVISRLRNVTTNLGIRAGAEVAIWKRYTAWALPGAFAILAALLAQFGFSGRQPNVVRIIALAAFGYIAVVSVKVFWEIGEMGAIPAWFAINASIFGVLAISAYLLRRLS